MGIHPLNAMETLQNLGNFAFHKFDNVTGHEWNKRVRDTGYWKLGYRKIGQFLD